jgi:hypothetical protein
MDHEFVDLSMISAKPKIEQPVAPKDPGTHLRARRYGGAPIAPFARPLAPLPCWRPRRGESRAGSTRHGSLARARRRPWLGLSSAANH